MSLLSALLLNIAGCDAADDADAMPEAMFGTWDFECRPLGAPGLFFAGTSVNSESEWSIELRFATTADGCDAPIMRFRAFGPLEIGEPVEIPAGAWAVDFVVTQRTVTVLDESARGVLESLGCDASGFTLEQPHDLNPNGCGMFAQSLEACGADYDIVAVENDVLHIGKRPAAGDICSPERRPTELDRSWSFIER